eukprot:TRINITY_DN7371_c0_g1_i3.p2 TRINITY_DN7371_c0_g1~~TRINITY_DN7371_c0_g1_i3.p2  ORF type:complete len:101 (-),score=28.97 TRINITY_DN7371_c0_g1_i3:338-640(-)
MDSQTYSATIVERTINGWVIQLDVDGGFQEVNDSELWRLAHEVTLQNEEHSTTFELTGLTFGGEGTNTFDQHEQNEQSLVEKQVKPKKSQRNKKKGWKCC